MGCSESAGIGTWALSGFCSVENLTPLGGESETDVLLAPLRARAFADRFQCRADAVLGQVHDRGGHPQNHAREPAAAVLALHAFAFPDQRFQNFAAGGNAFVAFEACGLRRHKLRERLRHPATGGSLGDRFQGSAEFRRRAAMIAADADGRQHTLFDGVQAGPVVERFAIRENPTELLLQAGQISLRRTVGCGRSLGRASSSPSRSAGPGSCRGL